MNNKPSLDNSPMAQLLRTAFGPLGQIDQTEEDQLHEEAMQIELQMIKLDNIKRGKYLPFERTAIIAKAKDEKLQFLSRLKKIDVRLTEIAKEYQLQKMHIFMANNGYPEQLSMEPLKLKKGDLPAFMVSPIDNPSGYCRIVRTVNQNIFNYERQYKTTFYPKLPVKISQRLSEAIEADWCDVKAFFTGHAPDHVRESIEKAKKSRLFDEILVIAEVENWSGYVKIDPAIGGYKKITDQLYFIDSYNMTPLEQFFKDSGTILVPKK